jgi:hypothetical protein
VAGFCEPGDEPSGSIKKWNFLIGWVTISFSDNILHHGVSEYYLNSYHVWTCYFRLYYVSKSSSYNGLRRLSIV